MTACVEQVNQFGRLYVTTPRARMAYRPGAGLRGAIERLRDLNAQNKWITLDAVSPYQKSICALILNRRACVTDSGLRYVAAGLMSVGPYVCWYTSGH